MQKFKDNKMTKNEMFAAVSKTTMGNVLFDADYKGGEWMIEAVETQETLKDWDNSKNNWTECLGRVEGEVAGFKFLGWSKAQLKAGSQRRAVTVVDFGNFRIVLDFDPKYLND